jgi:hypothetical protein
MALEYVPASHASHSVAPFSSLYDPAGHAVHSCPSASAVYPALHMQSGIALLPLAEIVLAGQLSTHGSVPGVALYLPSSHASHGPPCGPNDPGGHTSKQASDEALPGADVYPSGQSTQVSSNWYLPDTQMTQGPPAGPMKPALHSHEVSAGLPADGVVESAGQATHVCAVSAPSDVEYLPTTHCRHSSGPGTCLNLPASHASQSMPVYPLLHAQALSSTLAGGENVFCGHSVHVSLPDDALKVPASHAVQAAPLAPVYPALHVQSVMATLPGGESELAGHTLTHAPLPTVSLNVPALHGSHGPRSGPVYPRLHSHVVLPGPDFEDDTAEQSVQVSLDVAPLALE